MISVCRQVSVLPVNYWRLWRPASNRSQGITDWSLCLAIRFVATPGDHLPTTQGVMIVASRPVVARWLLTSLLAHASWA